jgi:hypothetical protein
VLADALASLHAGDPFGIAAAIAAIQNAAAGDLAALTSAHDGVLDRFDAMMTMLQKATGDRADILQMALWNRDLTNAAALSGVPAVSGVRHRLQKFIDSVEARTAQLSDYAKLLAQISPGLHEIASALGASSTLDPLIGALSAAGSARTLEKAHRDFLLALQQAV